MAIQFRTVSQQPEIYSANRQPSSLKVYGNLEEKALKIAEKANSKAGLLLSSAILAYLLGAVFSLSNAGTILLGLVIYCCVSDDDKENKIARTNIVSLKSLQNLRKT